MTNAHDHDDGANDDEEDRAGERCPVCQYFNSPPAGDTCAHIVAWTWDGQIEPAGAGVALASAWSALAALAFDADADTPEDIVMRAHARRSPLRAELIELAARDTPLGEVLEGLCGAVPGSGWSTGGMLGGSGHGWYARAPKPLDDLTAHCRALHAACTRLQIEVGEGGTAGLDHDVPPGEVKWELAASGRWEDSPYHSGYIAYYLANLGDGRWLMQSVQRNGELDDVTQEDVDEGRLNDDQIQAMWGMTLEEAQAAEFKQIAAACSGASSEADAEEVAEVLYRAVVQAGGMEITESDADGLLDR